MIAGRGRRDRRRPARAHLRHRRPQARGRRRGHRAGRQPGHRARHARPRACRSPRSPTPPTSDLWALPPGTPPGLEATARYAAVAGSIWVNATHVCTCEVDVDTGKVQLLRYIVSEDCGPMINPDVVEGQIAGGVAQGIGNALYEHLAVDEDGNPLATTLMDYLVPSAVEIPPIEYGHIETPEPRPRWLQGRGRGRRHRRAARGRERRRRRAVPLRHHPHPAPHQSRTHRHAPPGGPEWLTSYYDPYDADIDRGSVPGVRAAPRGGAALLQRAVRLLGGQPLRGRREGARRRPPLHLRARAASSS